MLDIDTDLVMRGPGGKLRQSSLAKQKSMRASENATEKRSRMSSQRGYKTLEPAELFEQMSSTSPSKAKRGTSPKKQVRATGDSFVRKSANKRKSSCLLYTSPSPRDS